MNVPARIEDNDTGKMTARGGQMSVLDLPLNRAEVPALRLEKMHEPSFLCRSTAGSPCGRSSQALTDRARGGVVTT